MRAFLQRQSRGMLLAIIAVVALSAALFLGCENQSTVPTDPNISTESMGSAEFQAQLQKVMAVQDRQTQRLMEIPGVVGTGTGLGPDGQPVVRVFVASPDVAGIPAMVENIPVDVKVTGRFTARSDPTARFPRPVPIGVSTGHPDITAGTIGARVTDGSTLFALSNNHVYANTNEASLGDNELQPGPYDGGTEPDDVIGQLADYEPILFDGSDNTIDAAIASTSSDLVGTATPADGYGTPSSTTTTATVGLKVQKFGRTTGLTSGEVAEVNVTVDVCYESTGPFRCTKLARFVDQISITPGDFSDGGDSGSLIVTADDNNNPVGLLFAGSSSRTIANPIDAVLSRFNVTIDAGQPVTDISVSDVSAPASAVQGEVVNIDVTVENTGTEDVTSDITVTLTDDTDGVTIGSQTISGGLTAGASTTLTYSWDTGSASLGDHTLTASQDYMDDNSGNDSKSTVVTVETATTDIAVSAVSAPSSVVTGDVVSVDVTVENVGNQDVTSDINVTLNDDTDGVTIGTQTISGGLAAGVSVTLTYSWDTSTSSTGDHTLTASHDFTDDDATNDSKSTTVTVNEESAGSSTDMYVWAIDFAQKDYGPGGSFHDLFTTVTIYQDSDADGVAESEDSPVADATVAMTLRYDSDGDGFDDGSWNFSGTTDSNGQVEFTLKRASTGTYQAAVTNVSHSTLTYNSSLDADNPDSYTLQ